MALQTESSKVNAGYRLPRDLVRRIKDRAHAEDVRPCVVAERWLRTGLQQDGGSATYRSDQADAR